MATDTLPGGVSFVSTSGCTEDPSGVPDCNLGTIAATSSKQYTITVTVNSGTPDGTVTNNVSVISDTPDPNGSNNADTEDTTVASVVLCDGLTPTILGTSGNNRITGTNGNDVIHGRGGNDVINGRNGDDIVCGGEDNDTLNGGNGKDRLFGENGNDT